MIHLPKKNKYADWSKEELIKRITALEKRKKYGLVWDEEKTKEKFESDAEGKFPVLKEIKSKEIITNKTQPTHILIEGDNYHALSVLNYTHEKRIDLIYIDPPYNTGNNSWKYNNKYVNEDDAFRHSKWISFMDKRLKLAKTLLKKEGVLCIAIDNYEVHNLRHLVEDIFTDREITMTVIEHNYRGRAKSNFALTHEYLIWALPKNMEIINREVEKSDDIQRNLRRTGQGSRRHESPTMFYGFIVNVETLEIVGLTDILPPDAKVPKNQSDDKEVVWPIDNEGIERRWYYGKETAWKEVKNGTVWAKRICGKIQIHYWKEGKAKRRKSVWSGPKFDSSTYGTELLTEIIGENDFPFPKSLYSVKECINAGTQNDQAIILDFFAGSGTTLHAVLDLNKEDNGNRTCILATDNENNICTDICYPRARNVIKGYHFKGNENKILYEVEIRPAVMKELDVIYDNYKSIIEKSRNNFDQVKVEVEDNNVRIIGINKKQTFKEGLGGNLKYFKTAFVPQDPTDKNKERLTKEATEMLCLREHAFEFVREKNGYKIYKNDKKYVGIIMEQDEIENFKKEVGKYNKPVSVYIFSLADEDFSDEFSDMRKKVKVCSIPEAILRVYRRIFK